MTSSIPRPIYAFNNLKGRWPEISEKQWLPVKTSGKARFYGEKLHFWRFYDRLEREIT